VTIHFIEQHKARDRWPFASAPPERVWLSASKRWVVQQFAVESTDGTPWEGMKRVGISCYRKPSNPDSQIEIEVSWSVLQSLKETLFPGYLAIEVYPAGSQVVDVAPMRWLWLLPDGAILPFTLSGTQSQLRSTPQL
jgi:hypothetical protein